MEGAFAEPDVIKITGGIGFDDFPKFARIASTTSNAILLLDSPGGKVGPSFDIAMLARERGFSTYVEAGAKCYSGCANIWLSGYRKFVERGGELGFHPSTTVENGEQVPGSRVTSALMGWYYAQLGLPRELVIQIFELDAMTITVYDPEIIRQLGVDATVLGRGSLKDTRIELEQALSAGSRMNALTQIARRDSTYRMDATLRILHPSALLRMEDAEHLQSIVLTPNDDQPSVAEYLPEDDSLLIIIRNPLERPLERLSMQMRKGGECAKAAAGEMVALMELSRPIPASATAAVRIEKSEQDLLVKSFGGGTLSCLTLSALMP